MVIGWTVEKARSSQYCFIQALFQRKWNTDNNNGILWTWRSCLPRIKEKEEKRGIYWNWNNVVVCTAMPSSRQHSWQKDIASRFKILKCILDKRKLCKTWWLWDFEGVRVYSRPRNDSLRNSLLHVTRSLSKQTIHIPIRYMGSWVHSIWIVYTKTCIPRWELAWISFQNCLRSIRTNSRYL